MTERQEFTFTTLLLLYVIIVLFFKVFVSECPIQSNMKIINSKIFQIHLNTSMMSQVEDSTPGLMFLLAANTQVY